MATRSRRSNGERLEELNRKKAAIEARQKVIRPLFAKEERARDARRKILVGAFVLHRMENDPENGPHFRIWLQKGLLGFIRETDRKLFDDILGKGPPRNNDAGTGQSCYGATMMAELFDNHFTPEIGELPPVMWRRPGIETWLRQVLGQLCKGKRAWSDLLP